jgi:hypothetical protein
VGCAGAPAAAPPCPLCARPRLACTQSHSVTCHGCPPPGPPRGAPSPPPSCRRPQEDIPGLLGLLPGASFTLQQLREEAGPGRAPQLLQSWDAPDSVKQELRALFEEGLVRGPSDFGPLLMAQLAELSEGGAVTILQTLGERLRRVPVRAVGALAVSLIKGVRARERSW